MITSDEYRAEYNKVSGIFLTQMSICDIVLTSIVATYFARSNKQTELTQVFSEFLEFEPKRRILKRIVDLEARLFEYKNLADQMKTMSDLRNSFAHNMLMEANSTESDIAKITFKLVNHSEFGKKDKPLKLEYKMSEHNKNMDVLLSVQENLLTIDRIMKEIVT